MGQCTAMVANRIDDQRMRRQRVRVHDVREVGYRRRLERGRRRRGGCRRLHLRSRQCGPTGLAKMGIGVVDPVARRAETAQQPGTAAGTELCVVRVRTVAVQTEQLHQLRIASDLRAISTAAERPSPHPPAAITRPPWRMVNQPQARHKPSAHPIRGLQTLGLGGLESPTDRRATTEPGRRARGAAASTRPRCPLRAAPGAALAWLCRECRVAGLHRSECVAPPRQTARRRLRCW